jgi:hypothetical protein
MKALLIRQPWIDKILRSEKRWELRGSRTKVRGLIALIQSGTGAVVGTCELVEVEGPLSMAELRRSTARHRVPADRFNKRPPYPRTYAWVLRAARRLHKPVRYEHAAGAVIWVNLSSRVATAIRRTTNNWHGATSREMRRRG